MLFIIMLVSRHLGVPLKWTRTGRVGFCKMPKLKKVDTSKACIKLMLEFNKVKMDLELLRKSNQYNLTQINKLLIMNK